MKKLLISILTIGVVSTVAIGVTRAFFSSQDEVLGNSIETGYLEINWDGRRSIYGGGMYFPVVLAPGENTNWTDPNGTNHDQRMNIVFSEGSIIPNHLEAHFYTTDFRDGLDDGHGSTSYRNEYTKAIEVTHLHSFTDGWAWHGLLSQIDDNLDGNTGFRSLYDLERSIIDDIVVGNSLNTIAFTLKMSEDAGNKFQGDSLDLNVTIGAAQVAGQDVL